MEHYKFFQNKDCEYFPCHKNVPVENFNCLFCYCPLYALGDQCGGNFTYTEKGIKNCTFCVRPHTSGGYEAILAQWPKISELAKKKTDVEKK